jgi:hypothetical protein
MEHTADRQQHDQHSADQEAARRRESDLASSSEILAEQRAAEDEEIKARRKDEDDVLTARRRDADREVATARARLVTAAAGLQSAVDSGDREEVRVANSEMQAAVGSHLQVAPEVPARRDLKRGDTHTV